MKKKFQVFVSSTFKDLLPERQAVVEAILQAGHIPAGMELFAAGDQSQWETITNWIDESDVYVLVLGGRYGSIEPTSGKSYIHLEYEYAVNKGKPHFAILIEQKHLDEKVQKVGKEVLELEKPGEYKEFRTVVGTKMCRFFSDLKDIKLAVFESLQKIERERTLSGWVRGDEVVDPKPLLDEMNKLRGENEQLKSALTDTEKKLAGASFNGYTYDQLYNLLSSEIVNLPDHPQHDGMLSLLMLLYMFEDELLIGVDNHISTPKAKHTIFFNIAPKLAIYGLMERVKLEKSVQRFQLSENGKRFLARFRPRFIEAKKQAEATAKAGKPSASVGETAAVSRTTPKATQRKPPAKKPAGKKPNK